MTQFKMIALLAVFALAAGQAVAADKDLAEGFADAGAKQLAAGKTEVAKQQFYKALGYDSNCAIALHEVAKLMEAEGNNAAAAEFYSRAVVELAKDEKNSTRRAQAQKRLTALNPNATQLTLALEEYAAELSKVATKANDSVTAEDAHARVDSLKLATLIAPEKMPKLPKPVAKVTERKDDGMMEFDRKTGKWVEKKTTVANNIPPDVERTLKAAGWTTIEGTWKKIAENVYEVTDGKLEASIPNGLLNVTVHRDNNDGIVKALVRCKASKNSFFDDFDSYSSEGYGAVFNGNKGAMYGTTSGFSEARPYKDRTVTFPDANKKNDVLIRCSGQKELDVTFCNKSFNNSQGKFNFPMDNLDGPMMIKIKGTATIESPRCMKQ